MLHELIPIAGQRWLCRCCLSCKVWTAALTIAKAGGADAAASVAIIETLVGTDVAVSVAIATALAATDTTVSAGDPAVAHVDRLAWPDDRGLGTRLGLECVHARH